ncbi:MAG: lipoyl synthase [Rhodobacterales bacterium]|nr:lipoyl synthase [Rhodobacterales bacterium]
MATTRAKPPWLKVRMPGSPRFHEIKRRARALKLSTVCEEARCPNIGECWGGGTATFMVMGDTCTRGCRFCSVNTAKNPEALDPFEPMNLGMAIAEMDLDYVVITSVDRDDVADFGAAHFANCIQQSRIRSPKTKVEVLIPDFGGDIELLRRVVDAGPEVVAHNIETVERLTWPTRDRKASYGTSMKVLADIKRIDPNKLSKSSIMVGLGETVAEVRQCMKDLRSQGCDFLTVGQYLQPTKKHLLVDEFIHPDQFKAYEEMGKDLGFEYVASGPLVRSSYKAGEYYISNFINQRRENV